MKRSITLLTVALLIHTHLLELSTAVAQGTAFTYQGRLDESPGPANGSYDFRFQLFDDVSSGASQGGPVTNSSVSVSGGLFTVTLDFGNQFPGADRWLEIGVRTNGPGAFGVLSPRQLLTATPYAVTAGNVVSGGIAAGTYGSTVNFNNAANQFAGAFAGNGGSLSNVNAATLGGVAYSNFWQTGGNLGANANWYLGTADYQAFDLRVNKARGLRLQPSANGWPNVIAGSSNNVIDSDATAASINGGAWNDIRGRSGSSTISSGQRNRIGTNSAGSFVGGGQWNELGDGSVRSVISGGYSNRIRGFTDTNAAAIAQGITDGTSNTLLIGEVLPGNATIGGGYLNTMGLDCAAAVISGGERNWLADGVGRAFIGGGFSNGIVDGTANTIIAGEQNLIQNDTGYSTVGGGRWNTNTGNYAVVPGGARNQALGDYSFASGRRARSSHDGSFVWADAQDADFSSTFSNQFNVRAGGSVRFVTSGAGMTLDGQPVLAGSNGGALTNLNAGALTLGTTPDARLSANVALLNRSPQTFTGTNIFNDRVGIGTTNPVDALQVQSSGSMRVRATTTGTGFAGLLSENSLANWFTGVPSGSNYWHVFENAPAPGTRLVVTSGGNVGIGTAAPQQKLDVAGSVRIQVGPTTVLVNPDGTVSITSSTNITFSTTGDINLSGRDVKIGATRNLSLTGTNSATLGSSGAMNVHASGVLDLQGSLINLN